MPSKDFLCNAGYNVGSILPDGTINACFNKRKTSLGNIYTGFEFNSSLLNCSAEFCDCPLYSFEKNLHKIAKGLEPDNQLAYDAFFHWHVTYSCNLHCNYCTLFGENKKKDLYEKNLPAAPIDIDRMMKTLEKTKRTFLISFIGGEPFLVPNIAEACAELTKKHYICFNTNLTALKHNFFQKINIDHLGGMHISLHIEAMERLNLTEMFISNVNEMQRIGFDRFHITTVAHPNLFPKLERYRQEFAKRNVFFKLIPMLDGGGATDNNKAYPESYTTEELELIEQNWLDDYFPSKKANNEKVKLDDYSDPVHNPHKRG